MFWIDSSIGTILVLIGPSIQSCLTRLAFVRISFGNAFGPAGVGGRVGCTSYENVEERYFDIFNLHIISNHKQGAS